jgi:rod shape-determining protein MreD
MRSFLRTTFGWIALALVGEGLIAPLIDIAGVAPDFTIIALVILAMATGPSAGAVGGFCLGVVQDLSVPTLLGLHALAKALVGFVVGRTRGSLVFGVPLVEGAVLLAASLGHDTLYLLVQSRQQNEVFLGPWFTQALPTAVYTALVGVPLIRLADILGILRRED